MVLLNSYQVNTTVTNKTELRDSWKDILDQMDPPPPWKKWTARDEYALTKLKTDVIPIGDTALGIQKALVRMHIDGAVDNMNKLERKYLKRKLELMDSERIVVDAGDSVEVSDTNTTNTSDAMDDVGDAIVPMYL